jgi:phage gp46-like protein
MTDVAILWSNDRFGGDLALADGQLVTDEGLRTAILMSLFTDARARADDPLPHDGADLRGWWGNGFARADGLASADIGSRLWLLEREKLTFAVLARAKAYVAEALAWMIEAGVVSALDVEVARLDDQSLAIAVRVDRPEGPARQRFDFKWERSL